MLGKSIKEIRKKFNLDQRGFAKKLNVANGTISLWENDLRDPNTETIFQIAKTFNVSISSIFGEQIFEEKKESPLESELNNFYKKLNYANQNKLLGYAESLLRRQEESAPGSKTKNNFV